MELLQGTKRVDFYWSDSGDFIFENGDIKDTFNVEGAGFLDEISRRIKSSVNDWKLTPEDGASINQYEGHQNNERTWLQIQNSIVHALTKDLFVYPSLIQVNVVPIDIDEVAIRVDFSEELDILVGGELPSIKVVYNLQGNQPYIMR